MLLRLLSGILTADGFRCSLLQQGQDTAQAAVAALRLQLQNEQQARADLHCALADAQRQDEAMRQQLGAEQAARNQACTEGDALRERLRQLEAEAKMRDERVVGLSREAQEGVLRQEQATRQSAAVEQALRAELEQLRRVGADTESQRAAQNAELRAINLQLQQAALSLEGELESAQLMQSGLSEQVQQLTARADLANTERDKYAQLLAAEQQAHHVTAQLMGQQLQDLKVSGHCNPASLVAAFLTALVCPDTFLAFCLIR